MSLPAPQWFSWFRNQDLGWGWGWAQASQGPFWSCGPRTLPRGKPAFQFSLGGRGCFRVWHLPTADTAVLAGGAQALGGLPWTLSTCLSISANHPRREALVALGHWAILGTKGCRCTVCAICRDPRRPVSGAWKESTGSRAEGCSQGSRGAAFSEAVSATSGSGRGPELCP